MTAAELAQLAPRYQALGKGVSDLTRSASPTPTSPWKSQGCRPWSDAGYSRDRRLHAAPFGMMPRPRLPRAPLPTPCGSSRCGMTTSRLEAGLAATLRNPAPRLHQPLCLPRPRLLRSCATGSNTAGERIELRWRNPAAGGGTNSWASGAPSSSTHSILERLPAAKAGLGWVGTRC